MPFDYSSGLDRVWEYKLVMHIIDDNLLEARRGPKGLVQTGTVTVYVRVYQPGLTIHTTTQEKVLYVTQKVDTYSSKAWYIFFVPVVGTLISLGLLIWVVKLRCCSSQLKPRPEPGDALHGRPRSIPLQTTYHFSSSTGPVPRSLGEVSLG
ncbi:CDHR3 protein, partial [Amia calva]|nr:CDHR3 protein [Amia calva]